MILGWFDAGDAKAFGAELARFFAERVPQESPWNEKKFAAKTQDVLQKMSRQVQEFKATRKIGIYKKAQIGNAFKWALKDAGYDEHYIERLTLWLVSALR